MKIGDQVTRTDIRDKRSLIVHTVTALRSGDREAQLDNGAWHMTHQLRPIGDDAPLFSLALQIMKDRISA